MLLQHRFSPVVLFPVLLAACLLAFPGCPSPSPTSGTKDTAQKKISLSPEAAEHLAQGQKFLLDQKADEALKEFQETVRLAPESPPAHYWLGRAYLYKKDKELAEKSFKKVLALEPENYHAMAMLGKMYSFEKDKLELAQSYLQKALQESPENLEAHFDLGRIYALQGERNKAVREFSFLFNKERDFFLYHFELGRILEAWGEKDKAVEQYKRAQVLNPNFVAAGEAVKRLAGGSGSPAPAAAPPPKPAPPKR
jgi:tetratricopeptide (TPR) repeat protein